MFNTTRLLTTAALATALFCGAANAHDYVPLQSSMEGSTTQLQATTPNAQPQAMAPAQTQTYTNTAPAATTASTDDKVADKMEAHVETRIRTLHDGLKITPDEEAQFANVAQTMRDNEAKLEPMYEARKNAGSMSAVDSLKSHQELSAAYANSFSSFISAFEPLYNSFSDSQKKAADAFFAKEDKKMHSMHKHWKHGTKAAATKKPAPTPAQ